MLQRFQQTGEIDRVFFPRIFRCWNVTHTAMMSRGNMQERKIKQIVAVAYARKDGYRHHAYSEKAPETPAARTLVRSAALHPRKPDERTYANRKPKQVQGGV